MVLTVTANKRWTQWLSLIHNDLVIALVSASNLVTYRYSRLKTGARWSLACTQTSLCLAELVRGTTGKPFGPPVV